MAGWVGLLACYSTLTSKNGQSKHCWYVDYTKYGTLHDAEEPYAPEEYPITRALQGEVIHQEEMLYRRGDGTLVTFSVNAAPVRDEDSNIVMAVSTFHDISRIKRLQEVTVLAVGREERLGIAASHCCLVDLLTAFERSVGGV